MTSLSPDEDLQALWQSQRRGEDGISLDEIRRRARRLERLVTWRNLAEYLAAAIVVPAFGWIGWTGPSVMIRAGAALMITATIFVVHRLHAQGAAASLPADLAGAGSLAFYRAQLERQRDLLRSVWSWYLLPFAPGWLLLLIGRARAQPERIASVRALAVEVAVCAVGIHVLNRRAAARLQRRIDALGQ